MHAFPAARPVRRCRVLPAALGLGAGLVSASILPGGDAASPSRAVATAAAVPSAATSPALASSSLSALDYAALRAMPFAEPRAALERAGWPAAHVRAFVETEIQWRLNPPHPPTADELQPFEFWRTGPDAEPLPPAKLREREQERERREEAVRAANAQTFPSADAEPSPALAAWNEQREWGDLPPEKRAAVQAHYQRLAQARDAIFQPRGGQLSESEWREVRALAEKLRAELAALLTPAELLDHDLRISNTANQLRRDLDAMAPTREEFLAIFRLRLAHELQFDLLPRGVLPEIEAERAAADGKLEAALEATLGPERYGDYRLSLQPACQLLRFDGRYAQADAATVRRLYRDFLAARERLQAADTLPEAERAPARARMKEALHASFRTVLDEEATRRFLQEQGLWP